MQKTIVLTGSLGFIGSNFIRKVIDQYPEYRFVGIDNSVKEYSLKNIFQHNNYKFYLSDIADAHIMDRIFKIERPDIVINMSAESFVDHAISNINVFLHTNIIGTQVLIDMCLKYNSKLVHCSTDEIYGQKLLMHDEPWIETDCLQPRNPYSCSKGGSELIINAAHYTHDLQFNMTRSCNVFGPRQKKENLIPKIIHSLMNDEEIPIHGTGQNFRQWIFVDDKVSAIMTILKKAPANEIYNIGADNFFTNLELVDYIGKIMNKTPKIKFITDRRSHDKGYKVSADKLKKMEWQPNTSFQQGMQKTINWYLENPHFYD